MLKILYKNRLKQAYPHYLTAEEYNAVSDLWNMYNPTLGPIKKISTHFGQQFETPSYAGHSDCFDMDYIFGKLSGIRHVNFNMNSSIFAGGKGLTLSDTMTGSLSETMERISGSYTYFQEKNALKFGSFNELVSKHIPCLNPEKLQLFDKNQFVKGFPFKPFTLDSKINWIKGHYLLTEKPVYLPAQYVCLFYLPQTHEDLVCYSTSGGLASHINYETAVWHGVSEVIERDAINIRWVSKIPPKKLVLDEIFSESLQKRLGILNSSTQNLSFYCHNLDISDIAVVTASTLKPWATQYAWLAGGGADFNSEKALEKAITEFSQAERNLNRLFYCPKRKGSVAISEKFKVDKSVESQEIDEFFKVMVYYGYKENKHKLSGYLNNGETLQLSDWKKSRADMFQLSESTSAKEKLEWLKENLKKHTINPIVFNVTPPYINHINVVKIVIPELAPPFLPAYPYLGHSRYKILPKQLGYTSDLLTFNDLNHNPLPYP